MSFYTCDACQHEYGDVGIMPPDNSQNYQIVCQACFNKHFGACTPLPSGTPSFLQSIFGAFAPLEYENSSDKSDAFQKQISGGTNNVQFRHRPVVGKYQEETRKNQNGVRVNSALLLPVVPPK